VRIEAALLGDLRKVMAAEVKAAERAVTLSIREATDGLKSELRGQVTGAGLGERLAKTWRGEVYPKGQQSIAAAGLVWSKAPKIVRAFNDGAVIRSRRGFFLAIPTEAAGKYGDGRKRITPGGWERRTGLSLRFVYRRNGPSLLVADLRAKTGKRGGFARPSISSLKSGRGLVTVPLFILLPQVRLKKRLDVEGAGHRWQARLPELIARNWGDE
jgi:hypothetical protein